MTPFLSPVVALRHISLGVALVLAAAVPAARADAPDAPIEGLATLHVRPDHMQDFLASLRANAVHAREETGNVGFVIFQPESGGSTLYVLEQWSSESAYQAHLKQPALLAMHKVAATDLASPIEHMFLSPVTPDTGRATVSIASPSVSRNILVLLSAKPEKKSELVNGFDTLLPQFRSAPGNLSFDVYQSREQANTLVLLERWQDVAAHQANLKRPVITKIRAVYAESLAKPLMSGRLLLKDITTAD